MKLLFSLTILASVVSCVSPRNWSSDRHFEAMSMCEYMCAESGVKRYTPTLGTCECNRSKLGG